MTADPQPTITHATRDGTPAPPTTQTPSPNSRAPDIPTLLTLIHALAATSNDSDKCHATQASLARHLSFAPFPTKTPPPHGPKALLLRPPHSSAPAAMALYYPTFSTWQCQPGIHLEDLFVLPEARGKGYGVLMMRALAKECLDIGGGRLEWSVLTENKGARGFYAGLGAEELGAWVGCRVEGDGALGRLAGNA